MDGGESLGCYSRVLECQDLEVGWKKVGGYEMVSRKGDLRVFLVRLYKERYGIQNNKGGTLEKANI